MADAQETTDPFEDELRSFRPVEPSQAVIGSIDKELAGGARSRGNWRWFARAAAAVAACVLVAAGTWRLIRPHDGIGPAQVVSNTTVPASVPDVAGGDDRPSLASYHRALARSPAAVDELLDRHAARLLPGDAARAEGTLRVTASTHLEILR